MNVSARLKQRWHKRRFLFPPQLPTTQPIQLTHRRIYILPTWRGLGFSLLLLILLLIAFIYNNNLVYLLCFLLASISFISILHTFKMLSNLIISKTQVQSVFASESVGFHLQIHNPTMSAKLQLEFYVDPNHIQIINLAKLAQQNICLYVPTHQRGWLNCPTITVASRYPFGLFRAWSILKFDFKVLIYPAPSKRSIPLPQLAGGRESQIRQIRRGNEDFYGIREYQNGDPLSQIHWKALAKGLGLWSKQYSGEVFNQLWLDYQLTPGYEIEQRLSQLCQWILEADQARINYGLLLPNQKIAPNSGSQHLIHCLEILALF
ncbi:MAG: hypothetical protein RL637_1010 [Pseudomonadota bacterium]|jgi:uncharacterized protein (DUF58 family)